MASKARGRGFAGHAATYAIGNFARRVVGFAMLPIYTRFLTPADYGVVGLLVFAMSLFESIFGARLGWAVPKFYFDAPDQRSRRTVIWGALGFTGAISAVSLVVLLLCRDMGAELLFGSQKYTFAYALFLVTLLSQPIEATGMAYLRLQERSRLYLGFSMAKLLLQLVLNLLLVVYLREGVIGVVLSTVVSSVLMGLALSAYVAVHERPAFDWDMTRRMVNFCWPLWLSGLAGLYIGSSGAVYLRAFDSLSDVGLLQLALRFATIVSMLIWAPFAQHWEPMSFQYYKEDGGQKKFQIAFIVVGALMFAGGLGISVFSGPVIRVMAAKPFYAAASVVPVLTLGFILHRLRSFFVFSFMVTGHTKIQSICQYVTALVVTVAYVTLVPTLGLMGAASAQCLAFVASFVYVRIISRRYYDPGFNLVPIGWFFAIGFGAYVCSNVLFRVGNFGIDLLVKSIVTLVAIGFMALVALREIRSMDLSALPSLPWPLDRVVGYQFRRKLEM